MTPQETRRIAALCIASLCLLILCETAAAKPPLKGGLSISVRSGSGGPPAHAPAHGYRRQHICGFELVFDVGLGLYVAVGMTDVYYHEGHFYRCRNGVWEISIGAVTWEPVVIEKMPGSLQIKAKSMIKLNGNGNSLVKLNGNGPNGNAGGGNAQSGPSAGAAVKAGAANNEAAVKSTGAGTAATAKSTGAADAKNVSGNIAGTQTAKSPTTAAAKPASAGSSKPAGNGKKK
ncbi:MAG: hypothetical protein ACM3VT_11305 [Solirubrobacterales bacterium]